MIILSLIYSTNPGQKLPHDLRIWLDRLGGNKVVTRITGFYGANSIIDDLAKTLRQKCSTGGSVKDREILLQGDHREKVLKYLLENGFKAKKAGG